MKSSKNRTLTFIGILVFTQLPGNLLAQCSQRIEISNVVADQDRTNGTFDLKVVAKGLFNGQLVSIEGTHQVLVKSFSGSGEEFFSFAELNPDKEIFYRVIIEFEGEEKFLCKRRVKDIVITDTH